MKASDFSFVLSGGASNIDPNASLGGDPSNFAIQNNTINNLFDDLTAADTDAGSEDHRCFYIFNDGDAEVYNLRLWLYNDFAVSSAMSLGVPLQDEVQRITIQGEPTAGSFWLTYEEAAFETHWQSDLSAWANDIQSKILLMANGSGNRYFRQVTVTPRRFGSQYMFFDIGFSGLDGSRHFPLIGVGANYLTPVSEIDMTYLVQGGPINTISSVANNETTPPGGVTFYLPLEGSPIILPRLAVSDGFPVWIKRVTDPGSVSAEGDGFTLRLLVDELPS